MSRLAALEEALRLVWAEALAVRAAAPDSSYEASSKGGGKGNESAWEAFVHKSHWLTDAEKEFLWEGKHRACWNYPADGRSSWGDSCSGCNSSSLLLTLAKRQDSSLVHKITTHFNCTG